jgi:uncharacterized membrane protein (DUF373 family)
MENQTPGVQEQNSSIYHQKVHTDQEHHHMPRQAGRFLDRADTVIYAIVGVCFLFAALLALGYTFWDFGVQILIVIPNTKGSGELPATAIAPTVAAAAIIQFVSGLLLVLIIMEVLGTVIHYLKSHETSLRPFLFIGIISATRSILSIGARLSVSAGTEANTTEFTHAMIELGVSAAVILALGITLKLLGQLVADDSTKD